MCTVPTANRISGAFCVELVWLTTVFCSRGQRTKWELLRGMNRLVGGQVLKSITSSWTCMIHLLCRRKWHADGACVEYDRMQDSPTWYPVIASLRHWRKFILIPRKEWRLPWNGSSIYRTNFQQGFSKLVKVTWRLWRKTKKAYFFMFAVYYLSWKKILVIEAWGNLFFDFLLIW